MWDDLPMFINSSRATFDRGRLGLQPCLINCLDDLEHHIALLDRLALMDVDLRENPAFQGKDLELRREWISQACRSVTVTSIAMGVVTTILRCSSWSPSSLCS